MPKKIASGIIFSLTILGYLLVGVLSAVELSRPRTYGEDLTGFGLLILPVVFIISGIVTGSILGIIALIMKFARKNSPPKAAFYLLFSTITFAVVSLPGLVIVAMYTLADLHP